MSDSTQPQDPTQELRKLFDLYGSSILLLQSEDNDAKRDAMIDNLADTFVKRVTLLIAQHTAATIQQVLADVDRLVIGEDEPWNVTKKDYGFKDQGKNELRNEQRQALNDLKHTLGVE